LCTSFEIRPHQPLWAEAESFGPFLVRTLDAF
jgi:hypothetical protein